MIFNNRILLFSCFFLFFANWVTAQSTKTMGKTIAIDVNQHKGHGLVSAILPVPIEEIQPFLAYALSWQMNESATLLPQIRFSTNGEIWSDWEQIHPDHHVEKIADWTQGELMFTKKEYRFFQVNMTKGTTPLLGLKARFYSPGKSSVISTKKEERPMAVQSRSCPCSPLDVVLREEWCPDGSCPENPNPTPTTPSHLIIHHSAGNNTANDWAAVVRAIWDFHVNSNGWSDIGYNFLVDPNGVLYVGRGDGILGAHFCGTNSKTLGFCMIGNYTDMPPTDAAKAALVSLLAEKACNENIDPVGLTFHGSSGMVLNNISGHRDGCATACPGDAFYPQLPEIRTQVVEYIEGCESLSNISMIEQDKVELFPNPTSDFLTIQMNNSWQGTIDINVVDLSLIHI